jgi:hypothetical protein
VDAAQRETRATLTALTARLTDVRATLAERVDAAKARQERLASLIADDPGLVLRHALAAKVRSSLPSDARQYLEEHVTADGELEVLHADGVNGGRYYYFLNRAGEGRLALHFAADAPVLQTGDRVRVSGVRIQQAMALGSGSTNVTALALVSPNTFGPQQHRGHPGHVHRHTDARSVIGLECTESHPERGPSVSLQLLQGGFVRPDVADR